MKNFSFVHLLASASLLAASGGMTYASTTSWSVSKISPFIGVDVGRSRVEMPDQLGGKIFRKNATSYNFFGGLDFNEYFGIELGYQRDNARRDKQSLVAGDHAFPGYNNFIIRPLHNPPLFFDTYLQIKNKYLGITAKYPVFNNFSVTMLIGMCRTNVRASHTFTGITGHTLTEQDITDNLFLRTYKKSKVTRMLRIGVNYKFHNHFAFRANATWIKMSHININSDQNGLITVHNDIAPNNNIKFNNSLKYAIGITAHPF